MTLLIGVSSYHRDGELPSFNLPCGYVDAIRAAGATPLVLPPGEPTPARLLDHLDGLVLAGGGDIDPDLYGGIAHPTLYMISAERDHFEVTLARAAVARGDVPMLCICRGLQVLNVALGGTLHPHLPERYGESVPHRLPPRVPTRHPVRIEGDGLLARSLGVSRAEVCSWHHQSVDRLGDELRAVAWSDDGVIEGVEHTRHPWCVGVQWHPEMQFEEEAQRRLFDAFVAAAARRRSGAGGRS